MREYARVRQIPGEPLRRWFYDDYFDLVVWHDPDGTTIGFQLCYDKKGTERSLTWSASAGISHNRIDSGEGRPFRHKSTPIVEDGDVYEAADLLERFRTSSVGIPETIRAFVAEILESRKQRDAS